MRVFFKTVGILLLVLIVAAVGWFLMNRDTASRLAATITLFDEDNIVKNFSHMDHAFLTTAMARGDGPVTPLPEGERITLPNEASAWIEDRALTALVVLDDGEMVFEDYYLGTAPEDRRISWSVAKSFLSALTGIVLEEGAIESLDDPVTRYAPQLVGSAYDGASIRDVLQMSSGVEFNEDYMDFWSDINKMGRTLALNGSMDDFTAGQDKRWTEPGTKWRYVSLDTHVIGMVLRGASRRSIPDLMQEKLIAPLGLEQDPLYITDGEGVAFVLGGLNLTTRDYARFAQMIARNGTWEGQQIVPADWIAQSTLPSANTPNGYDGYGYQWWLAPTPQEGEFFARGIYGQFLYIDQVRDVVIAMNSADRNFRDPGTMARHLDMFRSIARIADQ